MCKCARVWECGVLVRELQCAQLQGCWGKSLARQTLTWAVHTSCTTVQSTCAMLTLGLASDAAAAPDSSSQVGASFLQCPHQGA